MSIDAKLVKTLREKTGAGMMDCKNALVDSKGAFSNTKSNFFEESECSGEARGGSMQLVELPGGPRR